MKIVKLNMFMLSLFIFTMFSCAEDNSLDDKGLGIDETIGTYKRILTTMLFL